MQSVGVRDLKQRASEVLRRVRDHGETIDVTYRGRVVARLVPFGQPQPLNEKEIRAFWSDWKALAAEIGEHWPRGVSAQDAVDDVRRNL